MTTKTLLGKLPPKDAALLEPLFTWRGRNVYSFFGGDGTDSEPSDDPDGAPDDDVDDEDPEAAKEGQEKPVTRKEFEAIQAQLKAADRKRTEAEKQLKAIADKDKDELTKATERVAELEKVTAAKDKELADLRLHNAFLSVNGITWRDPDDALALAERGGYLKDIVDSDGKVDSKVLDAKLKELAKAKPHLVKEGKEEKTPPTPSGQGVGSGKKQKNGDEPDISRYARHLR